MRMLKSILLSLFWIIFGVAFSQEIDLPAGYALSSSFNESIENTFLKEASNDSHPKMSTPHLEKLPSLIASGCVNTLTGDFFQQEIDLEVPGFKPLYVQRSWTSSERKWRFGYDSRLTLGLVGKYFRAFYRDESGSEFVFKSHFMPEDVNQEKRTNSLKLSPKMFKIGLTNCGLGEISGQTNWKNAFVYSVQKEDRSFLLLRHGSHVDRIFGRPHLGYRSESDTVFRYPLVEEIDPDGKKVQLHYDKKARNLIGIEAKTSQGEVIGSLAIEQDLFNIQVSWSSQAGKVVYDHLPGLPLMEVHSTQGRPISYEYDCKNRIIQKNLPEGRCLAVHYHRNGKGKVKYLKAPVGVGGALVPTHTFRYRGNKIKHITSVKDAAGYETLYTYKKGRLHTLSRYEGNHRICREKFIWNAKGNLLSQSFQDQGQSIFEKRLIYDKSGNVCQEILMGNITGKEEQGLESYIKNFSSTQDSWHLPLEEKGETLWKRFAYFPKSNLLKSRLTGSGEGGEEIILKREFFEYDPNGVRHEVAQILVVTKQQPQILLCESTGRCV